MDDIQLQQTLEQLRATCYALSKAMGVHYLDLTGARSGTELSVEILMPSAALMNRIPTAPVVKELPDEPMSSFRYRVTKRFGGVDFALYCSAEELKKLLMPSKLEVASDATD